jgi:hypothetical protein
MERLRHIYRNLKLLKSVHSHNVSKLCFYVGLLWKEALGVVSHKYFLTVKILLHCAMEQK